MTDLARDRERMREEREREERERERSTHILEREDQVRIHCSCVHCTIVICYP